MAENLSYNGRVAVTGASSFVGAHLASAFAASGAEVIAMHSRDLDEYDAVRAARLDMAAAAARLHRLDIRDEKAVRAFFVDEKPDIWLHHVGYTTNYTRPDFDWIGTLKVTAGPFPYLYEACAEAGTQVLVSGTDQEYGAADEPNREDDVCLPIGPYGLCKLAETLAARQWAERLEVPTRIARVYIPFGRLDSPQKLLPQVVTALRDGTPIDLSPGTQRRDFAGIGDICRGYLALANDLNRAPADVFNIASGRATSPRELLEALCRTMGADEELLRFGEIPMRPGEPALAVADIDKARRLLQFEPRPLEQAIKEDLLEQV